MSVETLKDALSAGWRVHARCVDVQLDYRTLLLGELIMYHKSIDPVIPSAEDAKLAEPARAALAAGRRLATDELPSNVARLLMTLLKQTAGGNAVTLIPV
jgi:hypothetical protein